MRREQSKHMRARMLAAFTATVVMAATAMLTPTTLPAQEYTTSVGWGGGYMQFAPFAEAGEHTPVDIGIDPTWVAVLQGESWHLDRWVGLRFGGMYSSGTLTYPNTTKTVSTWGLEAAGLLRAFRPQGSGTFSGSLYLIGGGGLLWYGLGEGETVRIADTNLTYDDSDRRQLMAMGGAGLEILPGWQGFDGPMGIRIEAVAQHMFKQPLRPVGGGELDAAQHLRFSVTLFSGISGLY